MPAFRRPRAFTASSLGLVGLLGLGAWAWAFATGCAPEPTTPNARVAFDLGCTVEQTGVRRLSPPGHDPALEDGDDHPSGPAMARWEVSGCGRRAIYVCTQPVRDCWREGQVDVDPALRTSARPTIR